MTTLLKTQLMVITFFFRVKCFFHYGKYSFGEHNAIAHFIDYSVVETELLCALGKPEISV